MGSWASLLVTARLRARISWAVKIRARTMGRECGILRRQLLDSGSRVERSCPEWTAQEDGRSKEQGIRSCQFGRWCQEQFFGFPISAQNFKSSVSSKTIDFCGSCFVCTSQSHTRTGNEYCHRRSLQLPRSAFLKSAEIMVPLDVYRVRSVSVFS